jgi:hypothetical protein
MFLVRLRGASGTIECFAASGNRFPATPSPTKKGCGDAAAPLLEGLSLICADPVSASGRLPLKSFVRAIVTCHGIVKEKSGARRQNVPVFPDLPRRRRPSDCSALGLSAVFSRIDASDKERTPRRPIVSAEGVSRRPPIARMNGSADPSAEPAASWSSRFGP